MNDTSQRVRAILSRIPDWKKRWIAKSMDISFQIQDILNRKGWTQKELAERTAQRPSFISRIMAGKTNMTLQTIAKLEAALDEDLIVIPKYAHESPTMQRYEAEFRFDFQSHSVHTRVTPPKDWVPIRNLAPVMDSAQKVYSTPSQSQELTHCRTSWIA